MSTKLSQKLERINASVARIREKTNLPNAVIEDVATAVEQLGTSGGETVKTNIYKVATIEERDAITDMVEGDMCVVHTSSIANMQVTDSVTSITFPATVVLPTSIVDVLFTSMESEDRNIYIDIQGTTSSFFIAIMGGMRYQIEYTSEDGLNYTRTDSNPETIEFSSPVSSAYPEEWNDLIGYFLQVGGVAFEGLFEYIEGTWDYANIGSSASAPQIYKSKKVYTSNGMLSGTMGVNMSNADIKQLNKLIAEGIQRNATDSVNKINSLTGVQLEINGTVYSPLTEWLDTSKLTTFESMFDGDNYVKKLDLSRWNTSNVTNMYRTFGGAKNLTELNLANWDTSKVTDMRAMFQGCNKVASLDLSHFDTSNVTAISFMFQSCGALTNLNLANWDTSKVTTMYRTFKHCTVIEELDLSSFDTSNVTNMEEMFFCCYKLAKLDIRNFDFSKVTTYTKAFGGDSSSFPADCLIIVKDSTAKSWITSKFTWLTNVKTVEEVEPKPSSTPVAILTKGNEDMSVDSFTLASDDVVTAFDALNTANNLTPSEDNIYVIGFNMGDEFDIMSYYLYSNGNYYNCNAAYITLGNQLYIASSNDFGECAAIYSGTKDLKPFKLYYLCSDNTYDAGGTYNNETIVVSGTMNETATGVGRYKLTTSQRSTVSYLTIDPSFSNWAPESFEDFFYYFRELKNPNNIIGLENINMSNCTNINNMFKLFPSLHKIDLSFLDLSKVTQAGSAFSQSGLIPDIIFEKLQTNIIENFSSIFYGATNESVPVFDVSHGVNMYGLFNNMTKLKSHPKLNIPAGANINAMFVSCYAIPVIDVSHINLTDFLAADANNVNNFFFQSAGSRSLASEGAYADGIPYVYVKDNDDRNFILNSMSSNSRPNNWSTSNIIVGSPN